MAGIVRGHPVKYDLTDNFLERVVSRPSAAACARVGHAHQLQLLTTATRFTVAWLLMYISQQQQLQQPEDSAN